MPKKHSRADQASVRLLSGGNPQIPKADGIEPVQAYIAAMPGWKHEMGRDLHAVVVDTVPAVRMAVRWNSPFYGIDGRGWFLSVHCFARYVKVTFLNGASLDPLPPVESKHAEVRYLHIQEGDQVKTSQMKRWIRQASKLPGEDLF